MASSSKFKVEDTFFISPVPELFLGDIHQASGWTGAVVSIGVKGQRWGYPKFPREFRVHVTDDPYHADILRKQLKPCCEFIRKHTPVLIFSQAGTWRWTAAIAAAYLIYAHDESVTGASWKLAWTFDEYFTTLLKRFKFSCWVMESPTCHTTHHPKE